MYSVVFFAGLLGEEQKVVAPAPSDICVSSFIFVSTTTDGELIYYRNIYISNFMTAVANKRKKSMAGLIYM